MKFMDKLACCRPEPGEIGIFWLGQAGFLLKNSKGEILAIDPYLSDAVERICGLKRMMMAVMEPEELNPDYVLISHHDEDHLDLYGCDSGYPETESGHETSGTFHSISDVQECGN